MEVKDLSRGERVIGFVKDMIKVGLLWWYNTRKKKVSIVNFNHDFQEKVFVSEIAAPVHRTYYSSMTMIPGN